MDVTPQQERLIAASWHWFEKACNAFQRGDRSTHQISMLAHSMVQVAYRATMGRQPEFDI